MTLIGGVNASNLRTFACLYVFGNIIALVATGFLLGPASQCKKMWAETRRYSTAFYLIMLIVVFAVAIAVRYDIGIDLNIILIAYFKRRNNTSL